MGAKQADAQKYPRVGTHHYFLFFRLMCDKKSAQITKYKTFSKNSGWATAHPTTLLRMPLVQNTKVRWLMHNNV
jgi:hypothetical protein